MQLLMFALAAVLGLVLTACGDRAADAPAGDVAAEEPGSAVAGAPADGGLSVEEARASDLEGPLAVQGFVVADGEAVRICDLLMESFPPQCGGESLAVEGLDLDTLDMTSEGEHRWTDSSVTLLGEVRDGSLIVSDTAA